MPVIDPIKYRVNIINNFSLIFLIDLNKTSIDIPAPVKRPEIMVPNVNALFKYNSVIKTLEAQLGIIHIKLDINGENIVSFRNSFDNESSPIYSIIKLIINVITRRNINVFIV